MIITAKRYLTWIKKNLGFLAGFVHLGSIQVSNAVIQLLLFPLIIHVTGLAEFGVVMVANSYASLNALFINYGTNQSGIKDVALQKRDPGLLSALYYNVIYSRCILFILSLIVLLALLIIDIPHVHYFPFALTIIFAEVLNPFYFFVGVEKIYLYNIANLISKVISAVCIYFLITSPALGVWVNFLLGITNVIAYLLLNIYLIRRYRLTRFRFNLKTIAHFLKHNFFLVGNNLSVQLQQSVLLFALSFSGNPLLLGAYSFCDKIVWSFRMLIIAFTTAIFPRAAQMFRENVERWKTFRRQIDRIMAVFFSLVAVGILLGAPFVVHLFTGTYNELAIGYTRAICLVPLAASLNAMNVVDLLLKNEYRYIFIIAMILLAISITVSFTFLQINNSYAFGYYQVIVETFSLPLYLYFMRKTEKKKNESTA